VAEFPHGADAFSTSHRAVAGLVAAREAAFVVVEKAKWMRDFARLIT
jgi:hypothetical protein